MFCHLQPKILRLADRRQIPSVDRVLTELGTAAQILPRPLTLFLIRNYLDGLRQSDSPVPEFDRLLSNLKAKLSDLERSRLRPVINGTGVVLHTNLGRAPLGQTVVTAIQQVAQFYNNLEYDLADGKRGNRGEYVELCLAVLTGAQAATVVNNCAAALLLLLTHYTRSERKEVVISRGELIQIGGGFRIPDILGATGARLVEVGTTNQTLLKDYAQAVNERTALILKVHQSNFYQDGFIARPAARDLTQLAKQHQIPFIEDLGSGAVFPPEHWPLNETERSPVDALREGVDLVCFSGDKLFGGAQAGIIAGQRNAVKSLKTDPFFRALRCDKLILSALQATTEAYLAEEYASFPIWEMLTCTVSGLQRRGEHILAELANLPIMAELVATQARVGGGTMPRTSVPSIALSVQLPGRSVELLASYLRRETPSVVGYINKEQFHLDLRTVFPAQDVEITKLLRKAVQALISEERK